MHDWRLLCWLQCTAGLSGTKTSWNILNSSAVGTFNEPATTGTTLSKVKLVGLPCLFAIIDVRPAFAVQAWSHRIFWFHAICTTKTIFACFLVYVRAAHSGGVLLAELNRFAGMRCSPVKLGALHYLVWRPYGSFSMACEPSCAPLPPAPPLGGYLVQWPPRHSCSQRSDDVDPVYWGLLYKLIWEDAERGKCVGPCSCTASVHSCQWRQAEWLDLHVSWMSWFLIHCMHVFECDAVVRPLCPMANLFVGVFVWALAPFCVSGLLFLLTKRKSGWGICGSSGWSVWWLVCCDLPAFPGLFDPCTNGVFTAYAHVRTEPQCDIGHTRGKKTVLSDSSVDMQWPAYWHMWLFEESISVLFNDCSEHWHCCFCPCFPCPLFVCCLLLVSLFAVASLCRFWSVGFSACVFAVVFSLAFVCCLLCCGAASPPFLFGLFVAGFVVLCGGSPPPLVVASLPPFGCSPAASWSSFCAGPSLWLSGCFMRRPGCLALMLGVWWCFASSLHFALWQQRPLALCGVCVTLYTMVHLLLWSSVLLHWGIHLRMIQDPLWTPLSYTLATLGCMCDMLCSCPFLPSRRPFSPFLLVWLCSCVCGFWRCPSLRAISSTLT